MSETHAPAAGRTLSVLLVRPSKYDDDGYVIRHWRGVLPSNTLNCLHGLTLDAVRDGALSGWRVEVHVLDETVDRVSPRRLARAHVRGGVRALVALAGVQTNQFPRACDLAVEFKALGFAVMMGGFHVSGAIAASRTMPEECQAMIDAGITLVLGEVEGRWAGLLRDAADGQLQPLYDFLDRLPELDDQPLPRPSPALQRKFAVRGTGTVDMSRGCPFRCSFCTIISVQGRTMRARAPHRVLEHIRSNAVRSSGRACIDHYFFTDDNFSRNPNWEAVFDGLIALRENDGVQVDFMMQADIASWRIPRFVEKAARAGCVQVFIGMESIREDNLASVGKRQNRVDGYRAAIARWHDAGVICHVGYIIGFAYDTYDRVMADVRALRDELLVDQVSFFVMTPLPGSRDHTAARAAGVPLDPDYNNFDSFHVTQPHPLMSRDEWMRAFTDAWREFYSADHMAAALLRQNPHTYWGLFKVFIWYRAAMTEGTHPMVTGFFRRKGRRERRPSLVVEGRLRFWRRRLVEITTLSRGYLTLAREMQQLWLRTRIQRRDYGRWPTLYNFSTRSATPVLVKMGWGRQHAELAARVRAVREGGRVELAGISAIVRQRVSALSEALACQESPASDGAGPQARRAEPGPAQPPATTTQGARPDPPAGVVIDSLARSWKVLGEIRTAFAFYASMMSERY